MTREEYNLLFHKHKLNLVAFKPLVFCDEEVLVLVNAALKDARERDTALLRQALKSLNYVGVDPIDKDEWEETETIIAALRKRLGEDK